jgi:hypothetical protein
MSEEVKLSAYEKERNWFIPTAERFANSECGKKPPARPQEILEAWNAKWSLAFHSKMNELWENRHEVSSN